MFDRRKLAALLGLPILLTACATPVSPQTPLPEEDMLYTETAANTGAAKTAPPAAIRQTPLPSPAATPETLENTFVYEGLVDISRLDSSLVIDQRYGTENNFTGEIHYDRQLTLIHKDVAPMLLEAGRLAEKDGFFIKLFDLYRPLSVQQSLYDAAPDNLKRFVAKPSGSAKHCKGIAIDCTLTDADGNELAMPSEYDEFSQRASVGYSGGTKEETENREYLINLMKKAGFSVISSEWWHYNAPDNGEYTVLDVSFAEFEEKRAEFEGK